jgi:GT2 family glycosyltransferase
MVLPSLSIVIPTFNGRENLKRLLPSVREHAPRGTHVIVVDDGSTDGTAKWVGINHPWVQVVALEANGGFCRAVNAGIAHSRAEIVELLNDDTEVQRGWAEAALRHFSDRTVGSVAPLVLFMDRPDVIESAGQQYHLCGWGKNRGYGEPLDPSYLVAGEVFGPSGSTGFYRRQALDRAGWLLPEYQAYYEDVDLSFRLRWAGFRCVYEPQSQVLHRESVTYGRRRQHVLRLLARNEEWVFWVNLKTHELLLGLLPHLGFLGVRAIRQWMNGQGSAFLHAKHDALRGWKWVVERRRVLQKMARRASRSVDLRVSMTPHVINDGLSWMALRKSA